MSENLIQKREGAAGTLLMNRPKALNALDQGMIRDFQAALDDWKDDPSVRLVTYIVDCPPEAVRCDMPVRRICWPKGSRSSRSAITWGTPWSAPRRSTRRWTSRHSDRLARST